MATSLVLFDLDKTLFDTASFMRTLLERWARNTAQPLSRLEQANQEYQATLSQSTDFDPQANLAHIAAALAVPVGLLAVELDQAPLFEAAVYPEVPSVLRQLKQTNMPLGIFSQGTLEWQQRKLSLSGLNSFFEQRYMLIEKRKVRPEIIAHFVPETMVVDDKQAVVQALTEYPVVRPVWINRLSSETWSNGPTIHSLTDLLPLVSAHQ